MMDLNFEYVAILYVNACPVGFIDSLGFVTTTCNSECRKRLETDYSLRLAYFPNAYNRESVRVFKLPSNFRTVELSIDYVINHFERVEPKITAISSTEVWSMRKEASKKAEKKALIKCYENQIKQLRQEQTRIVYEDWWKNSDSENADRGLYNGD